MKIRTDFVSNSSSSSFVMYGKTFDESDITEHIKFKENVLKDLNEYFSASYESIDEAIECTGFYDLCDFIFSGYEILKYEILDQGECVAVGVSPKDASDDETLLEFKARVAELIHAVGLEVFTKDISFMSGVTDYNGDTFIDDYE